MSEGTPPPGHVWIDNRQFMAMFNALRMFALLAVPEPRRGRVLSLLRDMIESHSMVAPDDGPEVDDALVAAIEEMRRLGVSLNLFEEVANNAPPNEPTFDFSKR